MRLFGREKHLYELIAPVVEAEGLEIVRLQLGHQKRSVLQIMIERMDKPGVTVGDCQKVSRMVSRLLDVEDPLPDAYILEVSSPGLDRPLTKIEHFKTFIGEKVHLKTLSSYDGQSSFRGKLIAIEENQDIVLSGNVNGEDVELHIPFQDIDAARIIPEEQQTQPKNKKLKGRK